MRKCRRLIFLLVILFCYLPLSILSAENQSRLTKLKENVYIPEKQYLRYAEYKGGVLDGYTHKFFITYEQQDGTLMLKIFIKSNDIDTPLKFKRLKNMRDFNYVLIYDLTHLKPVDILVDYREEYRERGKKGYNWRHGRIDTEKRYYISEWKGWDGYKEISKKYRVKVPSNVPLFDMLTIGTIGVRFCDIAAGKRGYFIFPGFKNALQGYAKIVGKERTDTRIGSFNTLKVRFGLTNFFLNILLGRQLGMYAFLVDEEKDLIIKKEQGKYISIIDGVSEFNDLKEKLKEVDEWIVNENSRQRKGKAEK